MNDSSHDHPHESPTASADVPSRPLDAATQSLSDALRSSFRLMKWLMGVLVIAYALSGFVRVDEHEQALRLAFGSLETRRPLEPGLHLAWPDPINRIVRVPSATQKKIEIDTFWLKLNAREQKTPTAELTRTGGLNPVNEGAVLTGDRNILHARWRVIYRINRPVKYLLNVHPSETTEPGEGAEAATVRDVLTAGVTRACSQATLEEVLQADPGLVAAVRTYMQRTLGESGLDFGIEISSVELLNPLIPPQVKQAFDDVHNAQQYKRSEVEKAEKYRTELLTKVAGAEWDKLLEAIDDYEKARALNQPDEAAAMEQRIDELLLAAKGDVAPLIGQARVYQTDVVQRVQAQERLFSELLPEFRRNREITLGRLWADTKQALLSSKLNEVFYMFDAPKRLWLQLSRDPRLIKRRELEEIRRQED